MIGDYDAYIILQYLFFLTTLGFLSIFDYMAKRKMGVKSQGYLNLRLPKFISLAIASLTAIISQYCLFKGIISAGTFTYLSIPYFASISYFTVTYFREMQKI